MNYTIKIFIVFISIWQIAAQDPTIGNYTSSYRIGKEGEFTMTINLWGHVLKPGAYEIPIGFTLMELISNAGGPTSSANLSEIKIVRKDNEIVVVDVKNYLQTGDFSKIPSLKPGDTVVVGGSLRNVFAEIVGYLRDFAIILNAIYLASRL